MNKKYNKETEKQIYEIVKEYNPTFEEISKKLNINYNDLKDYINKSSKKYKKSLVKKIRKAKEEYFKDAKIKIENALIKKALGYYSKEIISEIKTDKEGKESKTRRIIHKYNPPSERAIIVFFEILKIRNNKKLENRELKRKIQEEENKINIRVGFDN
ncbi:hypothetical protein [Brachyspira hampsonii]|uniref:Uncharacterized protein n=1 Tax=Brachyspira hampsonii 30446 TaxID=1289135 RepID=A0A2U4EY13_9SPIR|nr:hypothetical protein [Brachyspira hampsonii]EKV58255.1 hypothetical protein A966_00685 [Brachyspira hampsonii 30446]MBW5389657.1 hypothetical protein [Brachyspira hampsonii]MBW5395946.1 hypothetical protein [Brachyspira hampsonii]OEJ20243.1 hypothetical protein A9495_12585 [Brachyspira hampsonii]